MATISKINGVDIGSIAKFNGVDIANIASVNGGDVVIVTDFIATIDSTYVDSELTDFPVGIQLNAGDGFSGYGATDWQYLHATVGGSECYVEVDIWDTTANIAVLWVKVPTISASADTVINLAITGVINTSTYVGETGDTAAQTVWNSDFDAVYHFSQDPSGTAPQITDSTLNGNNLTTGGTMTSGDLVDDDFGKGIDFDGSDDYAVSSTLKINTEHTVVAKVNFRNSGVGKTIYQQGSQTTSGQQGIRFGITGANIPFMTFFASEQFNLYEFGTAVSEGDRVIAYSLSNTGNSNLYNVDGIAGSNTVAIDYVQSTYNFMLAVINYANSPGTGESDFIFDELIILDTFKDAAWIKAIVQNLLGNLVAIS